MTPSELLQTLQAMPGDLPLVFQTEGGDIGDGYHVTEFKLANIKGIDCGARQSAWTEATLQLLDGQGGGHMKVGKFTSILRQSVAKVQGLGDSLLHVEFAHENKGMRIYDVSEPVLRDDVVGVGLSEIRAYCKPAQEHIAKSGTAGCCGSSASSSCCA
ncbi:DUF6428 family protein [uncultured Roseibium sp.]|uniref:DUF6428 family protein n=1 Tax=uncultured Roseibium sp. TaxID=1936171 RepID=UPI0026060DB9|nr:DUF6428 family protein [uncultured Roseibium sp.]